MVIADIDQVYDGTVRGKKFAHSIVWFVLIIIIIIYKICTHSEQWKNQDEYNYNHGHEVWMWRTQLQIQLTFSKYDIKYCKNK